MAKLVVPHFGIALKLPRPVPALIIAATNIVDAMTANSKTFPSPVPALSVVLAHIADLATKEATAQRRMPGSVPDRNTAVKLVVVDLKSLRGGVELVANADPENAASIAKAAGMNLRKHTLPAKSDLAVKRLASGEVKVVAKATQGGKAYEWQYSLDGKAWTDLPSSTQAHTTVKGLQVGALTHFRHRPVTKTGVPDWGQSISVVVT